MSSSNDLETITQIMMTVARRCETISEMQDRSERAALSTRQDIQLLTDRMNRMGERMEQMGERVDRLTEQVTRIGDRVDQLAVLQGQTELTLQVFMRRMENEIQRIWEQIQEILNTIRGRFPGNGKGG